MLLESALAYVHLAFIFSLIVFQGSLAALLRPEWFNAAVLVRLQRIVLINKAAMALLIASGLARSGRPRRSHTCTIASARSSINPSS